ncbi:hypothetical protein KI440_02340 [Candidatus Saccharibacteria bacterium TM7i]|nr:hypothetical protein KI440_02340 [Candidatus Saccharibacteria bacterium TM7i]
MKTTQLQTLGGVDDGGGPLVTATLHNDAERIPGSTIPTIKDVFTQPGIMSGHVVKILNERLCENIAPLLLMSGPSMRKLDGIGPGRAVFIRDALTAAQLRLRYEEERVHERAKMLFGSIEQTPIQALLVTSALSGGYVADVHVHSPAVQLIAQRTSIRTIGELMGHLASKTQLARYFDLSGLAIDARHVRDTFVELESRLQPWRLSLNSVS